MITGSSLGGHEDEAVTHDYHLLIKPVLPNKLRAMIAFKLGMRGRARGRAHRPGAAGRRRGRRRQHPRHDRQLAARMEQTAPPGGALRISHDTWRHVRGRSTCQAQPPLQVKGRDRAHGRPTWCAARCRPARRGRHGACTVWPPPLLGRQAGAEQVRALLRPGRGSGGRPAAMHRGGRSRAWARAACWTNCRLILDCAEARAGPVPRLLARAHAASPGQPYRTAARPAGLAADCRQRQCRQAKRSVLDGLLPWLTAPPTAWRPCAGCWASSSGWTFRQPAPGRALGPRQLRERAHAAFDQPLAGAGTPNTGAGAAAGRRPALGRRRLAGLCCSNCCMDADAALVVLGLARPELLERRPAWARHRGHHTLLLERTGPRTQPGPGRVAVAAHARASAALQPNC
jgi:hypothetical protein